MMTRGGGKNKSQPKLNFTPAKAKEGEEANASDMANNMTEDKPEAAGGEKRCSIIEAIREMRIEFGQKLDSVMSAIEGVKKEVRVCNERVKSAEVRISNTEDIVASLQAQVESLSRKYKEMKQTMLDAETRSRRSNVRLIGLPEKAEGSDACDFLEKWLVKALGLTSQPTVEIAHRIGPRKDDNASRPRTLIMKFLDNRDKMMVMRAAREMESIMYEDKAVKLFPDLAADVRKKQKKFDSVRKQLREIPGIRQGMLFPARLLVTYKNKTQSFNKPAEVEDFIQRINKKPEAAVVVTEEEEED